MLNKLKMFLSGKFKEENLFTYFLSLSSLFFAYITWHLINIAAVIEWEVLPKYLSKLSQKGILFEKDEFLNYLNTILVDLEIYKLTGLLSFLFSLITIRFKPSWLKWACIPISIIVLSYTIIIMLS